MHHVPKAIFLLILSMWTVPLPAMLLQGCAASSRPAEKRADASSAIIWHEGKKEYRAWPATDELAIFWADNSKISKCQKDIVDLIGTVAEWSEINAGMVARMAPSPDSSNGNMGRRIESLRGLDCIAELGLVYYADESRNPATRLIHTDEIVVRFEPSLSPAKMAAMENESELFLKQEFRFSPATKVYAVDNPMSVFDKVGRLRAVDGVLNAYPNWIRQRTAKK